MLGDCYGNKRYKKGIRFVFKQSIKHKDYILWLYEFFHSRGYTSNLEPRMYKRKLNINQKEKQYYGYEFSTYTFSSFDWIYQLFYRNGVKCISGNLYSYLTPLALAIWISDDGCWTKYGVRISSNCFTLNEINELIYILSNKYELICTIQQLSSRNQYSIYIVKGSRGKLRNIILPYIHDSMKYKVGL